MSNKELDKRAVIEVSFPLTIVECAVNHTGVFYCFSLIAEYDDPFKPGGRRRVAIPVVYADLEPEVTFDTSVFGTIWLDEKVANPFELGAYMTLIHRQAKAEIKDIDDTAWGVLFNVTLNDLKLVPPGEEG